MSGLGLMLLLLLVGFFTWLLCSRREVRDFVFRRGAAMTSQEAVNQQLLPELASQPMPEVVWGGVHLPFEATSTGFMLQGQPGSGKSVLLLLYLESILKHVGAGRGLRVVLGDPKREWGAYAHALVPPHVPIWNLNPFDACGCGWAVGADVRTVAEAEQLASALVPREKGDNNPYFRDTARLLVKGTIQALQHHAAGLWTLRDVLLFTAREELLAALLASCPFTHALKRQHLVVEKTSHEIVSTIGSLLGRFEAVAACWSHAAHQVQIRDFLEREEVLLLGYDDAISDPLMVIYPLVAKLLQDWILARNDPTQPVCFVIDEFRLFGKIDLVPLALKGRSAGASLAIAFQDISGLEALLGAKEARELCGALLSKGFLRVDSPESAKFAEECLGEQEGWQYTTNVTDSPNGRSVCRNEQIVRRPLVLPDEVKNLPLPTKESALIHGFFKGPRTGTYLGSIPFLEELRKIPAAAGFPKYRQRPAEQQQLRPLEASDLQRLRLMSEATVHKAALGS